MQKNTSTSGILAALAAFLGWGLLPIYWKQLHHIPAMEILCHRILWALAFAALLVTLQGRWKETLAPLSSPKTLAMLTISSLLLGSNWLMYIWCVNHDQVLATSLGYYITPLMNALLGFALLGEKMTRLQVIAIVLAALGVINSLIGLGQFPWFALALAITFALYGLLRKTAPMESLPGLTLETAIITPPAIAYILFLQIKGQGAFMAINTPTNLLLMGAGIATSMPLFAFAFAARRIQLITLGILQYIAPSIAFLLGVFIYKEPFTSTNLITFGFIWAALILYSAHGLVQMHQQRKTSR